MLESEGGREGWQRTYRVLDVDGVAAGLKETESTVVDVWINKLCDEVIDELHSDLLLGVLAEELRVRVLEDDLDLHANGQDNHGHVESHEDALAGVLGLELGLDLGDRDEQLFAVVHVQGQLVELAEDRPVGQVGH